jgi:hypothetical protein
MREFTLPSAGINVPETSDRWALPLSPAIHFLHTFPHNSRFLRGLAGLPEVTQIWRSGTLNAATNRRIMSHITRTVRPGRHSTFGVRFNLIAQEEDSQ